MSSVDFRGLRHASSDPLTQLYVQLSNRLAKSLTEGQVATVASDNEDIYSDGIDTESAIKYHSELFGAHLFPFTVDYYPPFEPDRNQVKLMLRGTNNGASIPDRSTYDHNASINGDPLLVDGVLDLGTQTHFTKSMALRMNRPTSAAENAEWLQVPDHTDLQVTTLSTGFSIFVRFKLFSLADQGGKAPTIFEKIDDSTPNNAIMLQAKSDGKLVLVIKRGGTEVVKSETAVSTVAINTIYDIFVTYAVSGNVAHIYVNNVDKTLSAFAGSVNWQATLTNHDLFIFRRGLGVSEGFVYGDFYDHKFYKEKIVSATEVGYHWTNKLTIVNIAFGHVAIVDHFATWTGGAGPARSPSFTTTSFTSGSFTTV